MSDILSAKPAVTKPNSNSVKEIKNDLKCKEAEADFTRTNILKWSILVLCVIGMFAITLLFLIKLATDVRVQNYIIDQIKNNILFIILSGLAILKVNIPNKQ